MPRPTFTLTDDEARQLVAGVAEIEQLHPLDSGNHKPFLRAFLRLVYRITERTFSPAVYRRLLGAFAPGRTPSTTTIAAEKDRLVEEIDRQRRQVNAANGNGERPALPVAPDLDAIQAAVAQAVRQGSGGQDNYLQQQCAFLQKRLTAVDKELVEAKVAAGQLAAERTALKEQAERDRLHIESQSVNVAALTQEVARLTTVVEDARRFALLAIDEARAETRAWKDRCQHAEARVKEQEATTEMFRRLAYRQGADIPTSLHKPGNT